MRMGIPEDFNMFCPLTWRSSCALCHWKHQQRHDFFQDRLLTPNCRCQIIFCRFFGIKKSLLSDRFWLEQNYKNGILQIAKMLDFYLFFGP